MPLPHLLLVVTPAGVADEYDNPSPALDYGSTAARRTVRGFMQPTGSAESATPGRQPVVSTWRLFTRDLIGARDRILWQGRTFEVVGEPPRWSPRFGHVHYEATLSQVQG